MLVLFLQENLKRNICFSLLPTKATKTNLIDTLTYRALKICSNSILQQELDSIRSILVENGYPEFIIDSRISKTIFRFNQSVKEGPQKCRVYLKLPWIGDCSANFETKIKLEISNCFRISPTPNCFFYAADLAHNSQRFSTHFQTK